MLELFELGKWENELVGSFRLDEAAPGDVRRLFTGPAVVVDEPMVGSTRAARG
jgi:hypothetical protein